jgi:hypothetical protein
MFLSIFTYPLIKGNDLRALIKHPDYSTKKIVSVLKTFVLPSIKGDVLLAT